MKDVLKKISEELAVEILEKFASVEVRTLIEDTKALSDSETGTFEVVITTENLDRYQEVIKLDGWDLAHYRNNPIVLWGHDHNQPIGMATSVEIVDGKMIAKGKFAPTPKAQEVRQLYDFGIIKATSVGFIEKEREGNLITKAELLEFSFVSVPANPYALSLAMEKELSVNELVTKGLLFIDEAGTVSDQTWERVFDVMKTAKDAVEETVPETVPDSEEESVVEETPEATPEVPVEPQERNFSTKQLSPVIESLKSALVALEALGTKAEEPEGGEDVEEDVSTEEQKGIKDFLALKTLFQSVDTALGDVLAELRQADSRR